MLDTVIGYLLNLRRKTLPGEIGCFKLRMYPRLARRFVDRQKWSYIRLHSGMQIPLKDAIEYLVEIEDRSSIERLKQLFLYYSKPVEPSEPKPQIFAGGTVTYIPFHDEENVIQTRAARAVLMLMSQEEGFKFVSEIITGAADLHLNMDTVDFCHEYFDYVLSKPDPNQKPPRFARR